MVLGGDSYQKVVSLNPGTIFWIAHLKILIFLWMPDNLGESNFIVHTGARTIKLFIVSFIGVRCHLTTVSTKAIYLGT